MQLTKLRKLQEHVIRIERRDDESRYAVADAALRDVVAQKGQWRMAGELEHARSAAAFLHLFRRVGRVPIDGLEMFGDIAVRVVFELAVEPSDAAVDADRFVHILSGPPREPAIV